eukprot:TRINITY_DN13950_c0_g1_i2.p1 TRINITY_DN13950_c0_g1~~TRINITY_DN13950_c0_g1_i2.p1  ORF type:complete len:772 (+),score=115.07 TRINITY_DN13950_c0_g1_i2:83-2398(+)
MVSRHSLDVRLQEKPFRIHDDLLHITDINLEEACDAGNSECAALSFQELLDKVSAVHRKQECKLDSVTAENRHLRELLGGQKAEWCCRQAALRSPAPVSGNDVLDEKTSKSLAPSKEFFALEVDVVDDNEPFRSGTDARGTEKSWLTEGSGSNSVFQKYTSWGVSRPSSGDLGCEANSMTPLQRWAFFVSSQCEADLDCRFGIREHWENILKTPASATFEDQADFNIQYNRIGKVSVKMSVASASPGPAFDDESWFCRLRLCASREGIVFHPQCKSRLTWVGIGVTALVYELLIMSLQVFDLEATNVQAAMEWICSAYWTLDVVMSFLTATFVKGQLSMDFQVIACSYISSWFCFDVLLLACQWNLLLMAKGEGRAFFRHLRNLRYFRLMRLLKLFQLLPSLLATITNPAHMFSIEIGQFAFFIIVWIHVSACGFYGVHLISDSENPSILQIPETDKVTRYLVCAHWASSQLQGGSDIVVVDDALPRLYALSTIMVAIPFCALFVSRLTNIMMELHDLTKSNAVQQRNIRDYLSRHRISTDLSGQVLEFVKWRQNVEKSRTDKNDSNVLNMLPKHLRGALIDESLAPLLSKHVFWQCLKADFEPYFKVVLLNVFKSQFLLPHEVVFNFGGVASSAYIVECGDLTLLHYSKIAKSLIKTSAKLNKESRNMQDRLLKARSLSSGTCVSEMALWLRCAHKGDLRAESQAWVQTVSADMIEFYVKDYPVLQRAMARHARHFARELAHHMQDDPDLFTTSDMACGHSNQRQTTCRA